MEREEVRFKYSQKRGPDIFAGVVMMRERSRVDMSIVMVRERVRLGSVMRGGEIFKVPEGFVYFGSLGRRVCGSAGIGQGCGPFG